MLLRVFETLAPDAAHSYRDTMEQILWYLPKPVFYSKVSEASPRQGVTETQFRRGTMR
jgi:hypothetical protein